jgi:hypothetical protein
MAQGRSLVVLVLLVFTAALLIWLLRLDSVAVTGIESQAVWVVRDHPAPNADMAAQIRHDLKTLAERIPQQSQPPFYFVKLDGWQLVSGMTRIAATRLVSLIIALAAALLAGWIAANKQTHSLSVYAVLLMLLILLIPAMRGYSYTMTALTSTLALWALLRVRRQTDVWNRLLYLALLALALLTAHIVLLLIPLHGAYAHAQGLRRQVFPLLLIALIPYIGWLVYAGQGPAELFNRQSLLMLLLALAAILLPGLVAFVQSIPNVPRLLPGTSILLGLVVIIGLLRIPGHPAYLDALRTLRQPDTPVIYAFPPDHPLNYYNAQDATRLTGGLSIDLGWRTFDPEEIEAILEAVAAAQTVWLMLPEDAAEWPGLIEPLSVSRETGYDLREAGFRFMRFDRG